jgi:hypothetical protein
VSRIRTAAEREEQAELAELRTQAARTADEVTQTLAELNRRADVVRRPGKAARRIVGQPGVRRAALAAAPLFALAVFAYAAAQGKLRSGNPERSRVFARPVPSAVWRS